MAIAALATVFALQLLQAGAQDFAPQYSNKEFIDNVRAKIGEFDRNAPFYSVRTYDHTIPLELGRTVTLVAYADEMAFGLLMEPEKGIPTIDEFRERWRNDTRGYAVMPSRQYQDEVAAGTPMEVLGQTTRLVLVRR